MLLSLLKFDQSCLDQPAARLLLDEQARNQQLRDLKVAEAELQGCLNQCKSMLDSLNQHLTLFEQSSAAVGTKLQLGKKTQDNRVTINLGKLKNKKTQKKVQKLKEFVANSYSYLQVIFFQCKVQVQSLEKNPNPHQIEGLISNVLSDCHAGLVRANSLKMIYSMLRDNQNLYPQI